MKYQKFKTKLYPALLGILLASGFTGCSTIPMPEDAPSPEDEAAKIDDSWNDVPAVKHRNFRQQPEIINPSPLPDDIAQKQVSFDSGKAVSLKDLGAILDRLDVPLVFESSALGGISAHISGYSGSLRSFLETFSQATSVSFDWTGSALKVARKSEFMVRVPQHDQIVKSIKDGLSSLGATEVTASKEANIVRYFASKSEQRGIEVFLDKLTFNTSVIGLQMAVINVTLNNEINKGFDWSALQVKAGDLNLMEDSESDFAAEGSLGTITGQTVGLNFSGSNLTLSAVLNLLSTYGQTTTSQNLNLKTLSGIPVSIRSGTTTPIVEDIPVSSTGDVTTSGVETSEVETGFEAEVSPYYDAEENAITLSLTLDISTLIGFRDLNVGPERTLTQPETQDQEFDSTVRLEAGETALVGGLIYESMEDTRNSFAGMEWVPFASKNTTLEKNAMFILLRPTVTVYGYPLAKEAPIINPEVADDE